MKMVVNKGVAPVFLENSISSQLSDEILHGMEVEVLQDHGEMYYVKSFYDYYGYLLKEDVCQISGQQAHLNQIRVKASFADFKLAADIKSRSLLLLPRGAVLYKKSGADQGFIGACLADGREGYVRAGLVEEYIKPKKQCHHPLLLQNEEKIRQGLVASAFSYENTQYRWGGKTPLGLDCSGLCSMAYLMNGIIIYRDAKIEAGFPVKEADYGSIKPGDLMYFKGHIGMYIGDGAFIHSSLANDGVGINSIEAENQYFSKELREIYVGSGSVF